ncbi:MAG: 2,3-cyclic 3-phosphodiesterase [Thermoanaerobacteraceae bacterium]|nr:2,3-cyclic 3-phosphodiesterase [Thermoanaerobacteraceae bacterium]MDN5301654.1 2,3-cyclic 3-phosphodiesterase [Thermoanaerobacteraceae bacterium]
MNSLRCFISIELNPIVKKDAEDYIKNLLPNDFFRSIKWVKPDNMHITLVFLGETQLDSLTQITHVMESVSNKYDPFLINLSGSGFFPNVREPRVFWIGIEKTPILYALKKEIDAGLTKLSLGFDRKPFSPHLTIGRFKSAPNSKQHINSLPDFKASFMAEKISLVESKLFKEGPLYTDIFTCPLKKSV